MILFVAITAFAAAVVAAPTYLQTPEGAAKILQYENNNYGDRGYNYLVRTSNGINLDEVGEIQNLGLENQSLEVRGRYEYLGSDGNVYVVTYTSGRDGFRPVGSHIRTP